MQSLTTMTRTQKDRKMEAELRQLNREQEEELKQLEQLRQEMAKEATKVIRGSGFIRINGRKLPLKLEE